MWKKARKSMWIATTIVLAVGLLIVAGCVRQSGGVWYIHEAKRPPGWPVLTPVGEVQVKEYPSYREAVVTSEVGDSKQGVMFRELFSHIKKNDIAMTAPVNMTYDPSDDKPVMRSMAFLYDVPERGDVVAEGKVIVRDVGTRQVVSVGVRGSYSDDPFDAALGKLKSWLDAQQKYAADGPPRYLGYNSPFVPFFWRYGEVQIPVCVATD